eukprot:6717008-Prymnesium_polylepis.1
MARAAVRCLETWRHFLPGAFVAACRRQMALTISPQFSVLSGGGTLELWPGELIDAQLLCKFGDLRLPAVLGPSGKVVWCTVPAAPRGAPGAVKVSVETVGGTVLGGSTTLSYYDPNQLPQLSSVAPAVA